MCGIKQQNHITLLISKFHNTRTIKEARNKFIPNLIVTIPSVIRVKKRYSVFFLVNCFLLYYDAYIITNRVIQVSIDIIRISFIDLDLYHLPL